MKKGMNGVYTTNIHYMDTHRGVAYCSDVYLDGEKIGTIENEGMGGPTVLFVPKHLKADVFSRMDRYLESISFPEREELNEEEYCQHLLDFAELGKVLTDAEREAWLKAELEQNPL